MSSSHQKNDPVFRRGILTLLVYGFLSCLIYCGVAWLSFSFTHNIKGTDRPQLVVLGFFGVAFLLYLMVLRHVVRLNSTRYVLPIIFTTAIVMRLILLFSIPIQEVDYYRYIWDGQVATQGVSPFRYSPQQVRETTSERPNLPSDLALLVAFHESSPEVKRILSRIHFAELPTVYPPVSQAVFALSAWTTPRDSSLEIHRLVMKSWVVLFDILTMWLVAQLICLTNKPVGWTLAYAWCPLVLKEFSNSGHLDSIAIFFSVLAVYCVLRAFLLRDHRDENKDKIEGTSKWPLLSALALGLGVGAKLYPIVLAPVLTISILTRFGWKQSLQFAVIFSAVAMTTCFPLFPRSSPHTEITETSSTAAARTPSPSTLDEEPPLPGESVIFSESVKQVELQNPSKGIETFLSRWMMNDFLFQIVIENVRPSLNVAQQEDAWFVFTPESWRQQITLTVSTHFSIPEQRVPFLVARTFTAGMYFLIVGWLCYQATRPSSNTRFLEIVFLALAWFWLLLPTQNPWYWAWAIPFLPFARSRAWYVLSGLTLLYYLRFWFAAHWPDSPVFFTPYLGNTFFDFVVTWIEFGPWFAWLAVGAYLSRKKKLKQTPLSSVP